ncbi:MAG: YabP/YqfC family sporulation protein [Anaerovoracaceae bacterium]
MTEHTLMSENRESLEVTAVTDVTSFDESSVLIVLEEGALSVRGRSLRITQLDLDTGRAALSGEIVSLTYMRGTSESGGGLLKKLMR